MRTLRAAAVALVFLSTLSWPTPAWPWGDLGHQVVCGIAFRELNPGARREVRRLIAKDEDIDPRRFAVGCTWPDNPRKRADDHFINPPRDFTTFTAQECPVAETCLLRAIRADFHVLLTSKDDMARLEALKFLGHWIGDVHQPLHVSFLDDRGGGRIQALGGPCVDTLHRVWDTCIVEQWLGTNVRKIVRALSEEITALDRAAWTAVPVERWATESFQIAKRPSVKYCVQNGPRCDYDAGRPEFVEGSGEKAVTVDTPYLEVHGQIVADRLKRAGVRLGNMLNQALGR